MGPAQFERFSTSETSGNFQFCVGSQQLDSFLKMNCYSNGDRKNKSVQGRESNPQPSAYRAGAMSTRLPWTYSSDRN
ncbi:hypothetical protein LAZ67_6003032 [Cordylochernes scorpioides]|uniref:Uncharacterized protein n=1 Tax=Cordylochernes scorpioides TaxID=51811 RepID=A0ABY6KK86_9ARAC|nr:hypothetical protein LAZ67_6003032 [Cordylochernes scorpioides]